MLPRNHPDRIQIAFDDHRLVSNAGLILPSTLALHLGLPQLVDRHLDLGRAPGGANTGDKIMTLVASALAGGDCIDDADGLRAGRTARVLGCVVKAPSTLGTFLRSFRWGHARQLDRVGRELLAQAWAAGAGPRSLNNHGPLTIDLDSTICETYGSTKEGARHHGYTGQRGYHPLLAVAAGTGDVLMARLREGRAITARPAASPCICRNVGPGKPSSLVPWLDCAPCRSLPDRGAGNRPATLAFIHQPVKSLSNSRRTPGTARVSCRLRPLHARLPSPTTGALPAPSARNQTGRPRLHPGRVPLQRPHHSHRWIWANAPTSPALLNPFVTHPLRGCVTNPLDYAGIPESLQTESLPAEWGKVQMVVKTQLSHTL